MSSANAYPPVLSPLLQPERLPALGPGTPQAVYDQLRALTPEKLFAPQRVQDRDMASACLAGLWLLHDYLDESHRLSQEIETPTGSFWHAIMHRREPDAWNSKYWWRRVGNHPIFPALRETAANLATAVADPAGGLLTTQPEWSPFVFVDLCEKAASEGGELEQLCRQVQRAEWDLLFDWCFQRAIGKGSAANS